MPGAHTGRWSAPVPIQHDSEVPLAGGVGMQELLHERPRLAAWVVGAHVIRLGRGIEGGGLVGRHEVVRLAAVVACGNPIAARWGAL